MYLSKITLRQDAGRNQAFWRLGSEYSLHQAIWMLFSDSPDRKRDFLYRLDSVGKIPIIYSVADREPLDKEGLWYIESKEYKPKVIAGIRLGFTIRVNPTCKKEGKRHDVVMNAKRIARAEKSAPVDSIYEIVSTACEKWLNERSKKNGFKLIKFRADGYRQQRFFKTKGSEQIKYSTVDITGVLEVINEKSFTEMLFNGLGPEKGFGCGLMLVRKI